MWREINRKALKAAAETEKMCRAFFLISLHCRPARFSATTKPTYIIYKMSMNNLPIPLSENISRRFPRLSGRIFPLPAKCDFLIAQ